MFLDPLVIVGTINLDTWVTQPDPTNTTSWHEPYFSSAIIQGLGIGHDFLLNSKNLAQSQKNDPT
jgi:hypothetical protein